MTPLIADSTQTQMPDFGVFGQLADYGPIGLAALALGYVAWIFIKRNMAEKDRLLKQSESNKPKTRKKK
jgi:hypothetical protein